MRGASSVKCLRRGGGGIGAGGTTVDDILTPNDRFTNFFLWLRKTLRTRMETGGGGRRGWTPMGGANPASFSFSKNLLFGLRDGW